jgi:hypothetical protein
VFGSHTAFNTLWHSLAFTRKFHVGCSEKIEKQRILLVGNSSDIVCDARPPPIGALLQRCWRQPGVRLPVRMFEDYVNFCFLMHSSQLVS